MATGPDAALRDAAGCMRWARSLGADRDAFEAHLATCEECAAEVRRSRAWSAALPYHRCRRSIRPSALRGRVLAAAGASRGSRAPLDRCAHIDAMRPGFVTWLARRGRALSPRWTLGAYTVEPATARWQPGRPAARGGRAASISARQQLAEATRAAERAQTARRGPELAGPKQVASRASRRRRGPTARLWSRANGLLFAANELPPLPAGRTISSGF